MKKLVLLILFLPCTAIADNPFFGEYNNQISLNLGAGVNSGFLIPPPSQFVPFSMIEIQYSRPDTFFTLPARVSLNAIMTIGYGEKYGWDWRDCTIPIALISEDVILLSGRRIYFGAGAGAGFQVQQNERLGAKFLFGFKLFLGYKISKKWNMEIFTQHFSNGNTARENYSYGFYGIGVSYNF